MILSRPAVKIPKIVATFLLGGLLTGQDLRQPPPLLSQSSASSSEAVLSVPVKPETRVDNAEILSETHGLDLHPYLEDSVLPMIRATWYRLALKSKEATAGDVTLEFTILKDGSVADVKPADGAGHAALADLAMDAVGKSSPLTPLPAQFGGQALDIRMRFEYAPVSTQISSGSDPDAQSASENPCANESDAAASKVRCVTVNGVPEPVYGTHSHGVTRPRIIHNAFPEYSDLARKKKIQGTVTLALVVTSEGNTDLIEVKQGIGYGLDEKAVEAVHKWKFQPATKDGKPVSMEIAAEVTFHLY